VGTTYEKGIRLVVMKRLEKINLSGCDGVSLLKWLRVVGSMEIEWMSLIRHCIEVTDIVQT